ncbi:MAG: hypothetical protein QOG41_2071 [Thermoleophilaceae bacterium]|nr:hypothetical protein [Thermoleophilaceae bacterium]
MRRTILAISLLAATAVAPASAHAAYVGAPLTHGPDPAAVAAGAEAPAVPVRAKGRAAKLVPSGWCGTESAANNTLNEVDNGPFRYHAVYMVAGDAPDRFGSLATSMQTDAFQASSLLESSYGRAIRFDIGTSCGPQYLDISVVRMPETSEQLAALAHTPSGTFDAVTHALDAAGFQTIQPSDTTEEAAGRTRNYLVWLDAPAPAASCGQATIYDDPDRTPENLNNFGGKAAIVFRNGAGFCSSNAARHEIGHNLGGLQRVAPHAFDGSHCNDAYEDTMCYPNAPLVADGRRGEFFDYGNDDYWSLPGAPLAWWTVDLNRFLCPDASCNVVADAGSPPDPLAPVTPTVTAAPHPAAERSHGRVRMHARRHRHGVWGVSVKASGNGRGVVIVRCRRYRRGQVRTVLSRATRLPRRLHGRVRCGAGRPRAKLLLARA